MSPILLAVLVLATSLALGCLYVGLRRQPREQSAHACTCPSWRQDVAWRSWHSKGGTCPRCKGMLQDSSVTSWRGLRASHPAMASVRRG
jgi:hypothetical protein